MKPFQPIGTLESDFARVDIRELYEMREALCDVVEVIDKFAVLFCDSQSSELRKLSSDADYASAVLSSYVKRLYSHYRRCLAENSPEDARELELSINANSRMNNMRKDLIYCVNSDDFLSYDRVPF